jgi:hypothetical protein
MKKAPVQFSFLDRPDFERPRRCLRWRERRGSYRPAGEIAALERLGVEPISERVARDFVMRHHYSRSYPAGVLAVGLFERSAFAERLVGVCVFGVPANNHVVPRYLGVSPRQGVECSRFVLLDEIGANAESFFLARANRALKMEKPHVLGVVSYADPLARQSADGGVAKAAHQGLIYQATNAVHLGRGSARTLVLTGDGSVLSERMISKLRQGDCGAAYAYETLRRFGAPRRRGGEGDRAYVARALAEGPFRRLRHPGNLVYAWAVGSRAERRALQRELDAHALPYPKALAA